MLKRLNAKRHTPHTTYTHILIIGVAIKWQMSSNNTITYIHIYIHVIIKWPNHPADKRFKFKHSSAPVKLSVLITIIMLYTLVHF